MRDGSDLPGLRIRPAQRTDIDQAAQVLARAFRRDPVYQWMVPDEKLRERALPRLFASLLRRVHLRYAATDVGIVDGRLVAVAIWDPPGQWRTPVWRQLTQLPDLIRAFGRRTPSMLRGFSALAEIENQHPDDPHWYLVDAATDPQYQGRGLGHQLLTRRLKHCDELGLPAYLEASSTESQRLYQRVGFVPVGEITFPDGPTVVPMWRKPDALG